MSQEHELLRQQLNELSAAGQYQQALDRIALGADGHAEDPQLEWIRGELLYQMERGQEALQVLRHACATTPEIVQAWYCYVRCLAQERLYDELAVQLDQARCHHPGDTNFALRQSEVARQLMNPHEAVFRASELVLDAPDSAAGYYALALGLMGHAVRTQAMVREALVALKCCLLLDPNYPLAEQYYRAWHSVLDVLVQAGEGGVRRARREHPEWWVSEHRLHVPCAFENEAGTPLFHMAFDERDIVNDNGIALLFYYEAFTSGFEGTGRALMMGVMQPGDILLDVGAHWGLYALTAATSPVGGIRVHAIEPSARNVACLREWIALNGVEDRVAVVQAAVSDQVGEGFLRMSSTMGNALGDCGEQVRLTTLDDEFRSLPAEGRIFLKVDVEGHERAVFDGAKALLASGRVMFVLWENVRGSDPETLAKLDSIAQQLSELGFVHYQVEQEHADLSPLVPYQPGRLADNCYSVHRSVTIPPVFFGSSA